MVRCPTIFAAFYLWYGTPEHDGRWAHWDHATLPHWTSRMNELYPPGRPFRPPDEPHSPFYPERGLYSSRDAAVMRAQFRELRQAGVDSIMVSWWGQAALDVKRDSQGVSTDELVPVVLNAAAEVGIGVSWHIEPYGGRSPTSVLDDLRYLHAQYGDHPAIWRQPHPQRQAGPPGRTSAPRHLPVVFLYDVSAQHSGGESPAELKAATRAWHEVARQLQGSAADAILLSLYIDQRDVAFVGDSGLDGAYTCTHAGARTLDCPRCASPRRPAWLTSPPVAPLRGQTSRRQGSRRVRPLRDGLASGRSWRRVASCSCRPSGRATTTRSSAPGMPRRRKAASAVAITIKCGGRRCRPPRAA